MSNPTSKRPDDLMTAPEAARALNSAPDTLHDTHAPLQTWIQNHEDLVRPPAERDTWSVEEIHQLAATGRTTAYPEGGTPDHPRRVLYSLAELRKAVGHKSRLPKDTEDQGEDTNKVPGDLANLPQAVQRITRYRTVADVEQLIADGKVTNYAEPVAITDETGDVTYMPVKPAVSVAELERVTGGTNR